MNTENPYVVTYFFEEMADAVGRWHTVESGATFAAQLSAKWFFDRCHRKTPALDEWLATGYRKHARRAKTKNFDKLVEAFPGEIVSTPHGRVFASELYRAGELPKEFRSEQLSNFKVSYDAVEPNSETPVLVTVNSELGMSFGKAVVAAAHSAQNLVLEHFNKGHVRELSSWADKGFPLSVTLAPVPQGLVEGTYAEVRDFGLTEVPEGSITAVAQLR